MIDGEIVYSGTNKVMADYARLARDCEFKIIGGCCGTTSERHQAIVNALDHYEPKAAPSQNDIEEALGPIKVPSQGSEQFPLYQEPVFSIDAQGSAGSRGEPSCNNSMEIPSGD